MEPCGCGDPGCPTCGTAQGMYVRTSKRTAVKVAPVTPAERLRREGGAAFPAAATDSGGDYPGAMLLQSGMSMRDYFAAQAMAGLLASGPVAGKTVDTIAETAYVQADAMLARRGV